MSYSNYYGTIFNEGNYCKLCDQLHQLYLVLINILALNIVMNKDDNRVYYALLQRVGNSGPYQTKSFIIIIIMALLGSSTFFVNTYLFYQPPYNCSNLIRNCEQFVCSLPPDQRSQYLSLQSMVTLGNFNGDNHCEKMNNVTIMQQAMLLGASVGLFLGVVFSDCLGRRRTVIFSVSMTIVGILLIFFTNISAKCIGLMMWGAGSQISFTLLYSYIIQIVSEKSRSNYFMALYLVFACGTTANAVLFYFIQNWLYVLIFYYALFYTISLIAFILYVQSPPIQIISKSKDGQQAYSVFMRIAHENSVVDHGITLDQIVSLHANYKLNNKINNQAEFFTFFDIFRYRSIRTDFIKLSLNLLVLMFLLYAPALLLDKLFPNIFLNGLINGASQFATIPVLFCINATLSRTKGIIIMFAGTTIFTLFQFIINRNDCLNCNSSMQNVLVLVFFFIGRFFINLASNFFSNSLNETFPAQVRALCIYSVVGIGRLSTLSIPFLSLLKQKLSLSYNLCFVIVGIMGVIAASYVKQTLNVPPPEIIQQLQSNKKYEDNNCMQSKL